MFKRFLGSAVLVTAVGGLLSQAAGSPEADLRDFIARWNTAYTEMNAAAMAALETPDFELIDRFGHWIKSEGPEFNERLWAMTFRDIYRGKPGPAHRIESIRILSPQAAIVQARAFRPDGVTLDDGTHIPPFWEIATYTLVRTPKGWRVAVLNVHNQIEPGTEGAGQKVPNASGRN